MDSCALTCCRCAAPVAGRGAQESTAAPLRRGQSYSSRRQKRHLALQRGGRCSCHQMHCCSHSPFRVVIAVVATVVIPISQSICRTSGIKRNGSLVKAEHRRCHIRCAWFCRFHYRRRVEKVKCICGFASPYVGHRLPVRKRSRENNKNKKKPTMRCKLSSQRSSTSLDKKYESDL